jgi:hypothetical protein
LKGLSITAASLFPSELEAIEDQLEDGGDVSGFQVSPESLLVYIPPPFTTAASFVPSELEHIDSHCIIGAFVLFQVTPESLLLNIPKLYALHVASLVPSELDTIVRQYGDPDNPELRWTHVDPESLLVHIDNPSSAASLFPSALEAIEYQNLFSAPVLVQVNPESMLVYIPT